MKEKGWITLVVCIAIGLVAIFVLQEQSISYQRGYADGQMEFVNWNCELDGVHNDTIICKTEDTPHLDGYCWYEKEFSSYCAIENHITEYPIFKECRYPGRSEGHNTGIMDMRDIGEKV